MLFDITVLHLYFPVLPIKFNPFNATFRENLLPAVNTVDGKSIAVGVGSRGVKRTDSTG